MIFTKPGSEEREIVAAVRSGEPSWGYYTKNRIESVEHWYATMDVRDWHYYLEIARWKGEGYSSKDELCAGCSHPAADHTSMLNATCTHNGCYCRRTPSLQPNLPWDKPVRVTIPETFWTSKWRGGKRGEVWLGRLCAHSGGGVCLQPSLRDDPDAACIPLNLSEVTIEPLDGKLEDWI